MDISDLDRESFIQTNQLLFDDDDELFCFFGMVGRRKVGTVVRDPHHRESPTRREQDMNLHRT